MLTSGSLESAGTHGNEYTGVYVLKWLEAQRDNLEGVYPSLKIATLLANPKAHAENRRFVDDDLNRMFSRECLSDYSLVGYECDRAKAIERQLGPKGASASVDCCIDLHTTTANMGCTLIVNSYSALGLRSAAYVSEHWDDACRAEVAAATAALEGQLPPSPHPLRVYLHDTTQERAPYLSSVAREGITIEVGPTAQGRVATRKRCHQQRPQ